MYAALLTAVFTPPFNPTIWMWLHDFYASVYTFFYRIIPGMAQTLACDIIDWRLNLCLKMVTNDSKEFHRWKWHWYSGLERDFIELSYTAMN